MITTDAYGGPVETWTDITGMSSVPASVEPLSGRELANAQTVNAETTTKITMRYMAGIIAANRITFEGKFYNLQSVIDRELKHRELIIMASEGLNEG
jgi:SPP1 family predicted phage head-tail adaptor